MKNELVVKDNALINASYNLELTEQRLILLAIVSARENGQGITSETVIRINARDYAQRFGITNETLPLYSAALFDVVKAYVIESRRVPDILRASNVGTRVERSDIVAVLQNHWSGFKPTKPTKRLTA